MHCRICLGASDLCQTVTKTNMENDSADRKVLSDNVSCELCSLNECHWPSERHCAFSHLRGNLSDRALIVFPPMALVIVKRNIAPSQYVLTVKSVLSPPLYHRENINNSKAEWRFLEDILIDRLRTLPFV